MPDSKDGSAIPGFTVGDVLKHKQGNPYKISAKEWATSEGFEDVLEAVEELATDSVVPALCREGCEVEPDGRYEHNCPSVLIALRLI